MAMLFSSSVVERYSCTSPVDPEYMCPFNALNFLMCMLVPACWRSQVQLLETWRFSVTGAISILIYFWMLADNSSALSRWNWKATNSMENRSCTWQDNILYGYYPQLQEQPKSGTGLAIPQIEIFTVCKQSITFLWQSSLLVTEHSWAFKILIP